MKRRRNILKQVKGYRFGRSKKEGAAREAIVHAGKYAFAHRRDKKNDFRKQWQVTISAGVKPLGLSYSVFMGKLKKKNIGLDRKILADLAVNHTTSFTKIVESVK